MFLKIALGLLAILAVFLIIVARQSADFRVTRSITVAAPPAVPFAKVNDLHRWQEWSPWVKRDPQMKQTYSGAESGVGAEYAWAGNSEVGEGHMLITESRPAESVQLKLDFLKPFAGTNYAEFTFQPDSTGTKVTWTMYGKKNFITKGIGLFLSMDQMIGKDFEKGLADLKAAAEAAPK